MSFFLPRNCADLRARSRIRSSSLSLFSCARCSFAFNCSEVKDGDISNLRNLKGSLADGTMVRLSLLALNTLNAMKFLLFAKTKHFNLLSGIEPLRNAVIFFFFRAGPSTASVLLENVGFCFSWTRLPPGDAVTYPISRNTKSFLPRYDTTVTLRVCARLNTGNKPRRMKLLFVSVFRSFVTAIF